MQNKIYEENLSFDFPPNFIHLLLAADHSPLKFLLSMAATNGFSRNVFIIFSTVL